jgi:hypothetical protein
VTAPYEGTPRCMGIVHHSDGTCSKEVGYDAGIQNCFVPDETFCDHKNHQWSHLVPPSVCRCTANALRGKQGILHNIFSGKCLAADPLVRFLDDTGSILSLLNIFTSL